MCMRRSPAQSAAPGSRLKRITPQVVGQVDISVEVDPARDVEILASRWRPVLAGLVLVQLLGVAISRLGSVEDPEMLAGAAVLVHRLLGSQPLSVRTALGVQNFAPVCPER